MTWVDQTSSSTPSWTDASSETVLAWNAQSGASAIGNASRFVQAADRQDAEGSVDFFDVFSARSPWAITGASPIAFSSRSRNDPT